MSPNSIGSVHSRDDMKKDFLIVFWTGFVIFPSLFLVPATSMSFQWSLNCCSCQLPACATWRSSRMGQTAHSGAPSTGSSTTPLLAPALGCSRRGLLSLSGMLGTWCCHHILLWVWLAQPLRDVGYVVLSWYSAVYVPCSASQECWVCGVVMAFLLLLWLAQPLRDIGYVVSSYFTVSVTCSVSCGCWVCVLVIVFYCGHGLPSLSGMLGTWCCHCILL